MEIYWTRDSIPALRGLSPMEKKAVVMSVVRDVWRHWQVWLPFALLILGYALFFLLAPSVPYRLPIVVVSIFVFSRVAALPFHSYLQHYLSTRRGEP